MPSEHCTAIDQHTFHGFLNHLPHMKANQIEDLLSSAKAIRRTRASLAEIEARIENTRECPSCDSEQRQNDFKTNQTWWIRH